MSDTQLGILATAEAQRDATHVAVAPMIAADDMPPGTHCGLVGDGMVGTGGVPIGIVDPFLSKPVKKGQRFFLCLYPRTVTGLRHHYTHPVLDSAEPSKEWVTRYAESFGDSFEAMMAGADRWVNSGKWGEYYYGPPCGEDGNTYHGTFEGESTSPEFWDHYERIRGVKVPEGKRESFFTCSC